MIASMYQIFDQISCWPNSHIWLDCHSLFMINPLTISYISLQMLIIFPTSLYLQLHSSDLPLPSTLSDGKVVKD